jgi:hypothetical protein
MKIGLRYFTGTGNSWKVMDTCKSIFQMDGHQVEMQEITSESGVPLTDILGFCFPVYASGIPGICRNYLQSIKQFETKQKVFVLIVGGDADESGYAINECKRILNSKNCEIFYSDIIQMPINGTTSPKTPFPPSKDEAKRNIERGVIQAKISAVEIIIRIHKNH